MTVQEAHSSTVVFGWNPMWASTTILVITYAAIISEKINRAILALLGASLMIMLGVLNQERAVEGIDFNTIALLTGMMVMVAITGKTGVFQFVAVWMAKRVDARPARILAMLPVLTAAFSALLDNVTTVLLLTPVVLLITDQLNVKAYPFLVVEILASNIGGTATLVGDPPNILIGSAVGLTFNQFLFALGAPVVVILVTVILISHLIWGRSMTTSEDLRQQVLAFNERDAIRDKKLLRKCEVVLSLVLFGFFAGHALHMEPGTVALAGAALLLLLDNWGRNAEDQSHGVHKAFGDVEWVTIFFFVGLFIIVAGVEHAGVLEVLAKEMLALTGGDMTLTAFTVLWTSALLSTVLDNIPFVATMIPTIQAMGPQFGGQQELTPLWWALSLGACLGGNGSLIGASANLTVAAFAERARQPIRFMQFMKVAFPMMVITVAIANVYLWLRYL